MIHAAVLHHLSGAGVPDLAILCVKANTARNNMIQDKEQLVFCYQAVAMHLERYLLSKNIRINPDAAHQENAPDSGKSSKESSQPTSGRPASIIKGMSPRARTTTTSGSKPPSGASTPSAADDLFSQNPVSFGQILSCVSGMTCRTSTAPTPPHHTSPEAGGRGTQNLTTTVEPGLDAKLGSNGVMDATLPVTGDETDGASVTSFAPASNRTGLTQKELTNYEEKEVAEEKDDEADVRSDVENGFNNVEPQNGLEMSENGLENGASDETGILAPNLVSAMDPSQFTLKLEPDVAPNLKKQKPGKNSFLNRNEPDASDPLSSLDPIWNRKGN